MIKMQSTQHLRINKVANTVGRKIMQMQIIDDTDIPLFATHDSTRIASDRYATIDMILPKQIQTKKYTIIWPHALGHRPVSFKV